MSLNIYLTESGPGPVQGGTARTGSCVEGGTGLYRVSGLRTWASGPVREARTSFTHLISQVRLPHPVNSLFLEDVWVFLNLKEREI